MAETVEAARFAASRLRVQAEADPSVTTHLEAALSCAYNALSSSTRTRAHGRATPRRLWARPQSAVRATCTTPTEHHAAMELHGGVGARQAGPVELPQWVDEAARTVTAAPGIPAEDVRVVNRFPGDGSGNMGMAKMHSVLAAAVARELGRPVKPALTCEQVFPFGGSRPAARWEVAMGAERDGWLAMISHESRSTTSEVNDYLGPAASRRGTSTLARTSPPRTT